MSDPKKTKHPESKTEVPQKQNDPTGVDPTEMPDTSVHQPKPNADSPEPRVQL